MGATCRPEPASQAVVPVVADAEALAKVAEDDEMMADVLKVHSLLGLPPTVHQQMM